ncbi:MAG: type II secretion system protein GspG [Candidatus Sumerlaeia bacterium]|nr:type II secretion system protein GspG [Candidatus Sumerlaeia bacterium]
MRASAFTLIELLIVVAIIAILAAIAVPNFLEAQVRSKVSRAKADMRTLATAIEAYRVDENRYPNTRRGGNWLLFYQRLAFLTTPVAYITTLPQDPFADAGSTNNPQLAYDYLDRPSTLSLLPAVWNPFPGNGDAANKAWRILSLGPDQRESLVLGPQPVEYDPTNGTTSAGDIHRYGP